MVMKAWKNVEREREEMSNLQVREEVEQGRSGRSKRKVDEDEAEAKVWAGRCEISEMSYRARRGGRFRKVE
jgi:hypothetical protein